MASFGYVAINAQGSELTGDIAAPDLNAAREALRVRGLLALDLTERAASSEGLRSLVTKVKPKALQIFSRQFATMIEAGLNVVTALVILEEQTEDRKFADDHLRGALRRRGRPPALRGARAPPEDLLAPLRLDGRGR